MQKVGIAKRAVPRLVGHSVHPDSNIHEVVGLVGHQSSLSKEINDSLRFYLLQLIFYEFYLSLQISTTYFLILWIQITGLK